MKSTIQRSFIETLPQKVGEEVRIQGFIHRTKQLKNVAFLIVKDVTGMVQCALSPEMWRWDLWCEGAVAVTGTVICKTNQWGPVEIGVKALEVISPSLESLPFPVNLPQLEARLDHLFQHRVLSFRHPKEKAMAQMASEISFQFEVFLRGQGFTKIHSPKLVKEGAEGGAEVFSLDYFGQRAYLAQSPQFYKQMMVLSGLERVYEVGPVFRAEPHSTSRHLNEYVGLDLEMGFVEEISILMDLETNLLRHIFEAVEASMGETLKALQISMPQVPAQIPVMTLEEGINILKVHFGKAGAQSDIDPEGERLLSQHVKEKYNTDFLFLTAYPIAKRPMYAMPDGEGKTKSFDLLFRGLEITTGGLRIHQLPLLIESMKKRGLDPQNYESYLESFRYGPIPHGGLGIGLERLTAQILGLDNVKRASLFPRDCQRLTP